MSNYTERRLMPHSTTVTQELRNGRSVTVTHTQWAVMEVEIGHRHSMECAANGCTDPDNWAVERPYGCNPVEQQRSRRQGNPFA